MFMLNTFLNRFLVFIDAFMTNVKMNDSVNNLAIIKSNFEMEVRRITWLDHDHGTTYKPQVIIINTGTVLLL